MIDTIFHYLFSFLQCFMNFFISYTFLDSIFTTKHKCLSVNLLIVFISSFLLTYINSFANPIFNTFAAFAIITCMLIIIFKGKIVNLLFAGILIVAITIGCEFIPLAIFSAISKITVSEIAAQTITTVGFSFISTGIFFVISIVAKFLLNTFRKLKPSDEKNFNPALVLLPVLSIFFAYFIVEVSTLAKFSTALTIQSIIIIMSLIIVNIIVFASDSDMRKKHHYKTQIAEMRAQGEMKETVIMQQDLNYKEMNSLVHDFKHQLLTLQMQINSSNTDLEHQKISNDISSAIENLPYQELYQAVSCNALRCILMHTHNECQHLGITFVTKIGFSDFDFISYQDICTIFSNAFENAICACEEMRKHNLSATISLKIQPINDMISVHIINDKINDINEDNGNILTSKPDGIHHGIGLSNIKRTIQKYGGTMQTSFTENVFTIAFLFTLPNQ